MNRIRELLAEIATEPPARWERLVKQHFADDGVLAAQALLWLRADLDKVADDAAPPVLGSDQRYVLGARLDTGATAAVWQAYDKKLGRHVAVKLFHNESGPAVDEARAACDVISDHVIRVLDVHDSERPYIVMELVGEHDPQRGELVPGVSAAVARPFDIAEAVRWVRDVARGVHDAHLRDVFHRDLKPHNVLITPVSRRARIGDFGLAVSATEAPLALMTGGPSGPLRIAGTPAYMAPEQARGLPTTLDPGDATDRARLVAIDVWGLGALACDLLCGHPPWRARGDDSLAWEIAASGARPELATRTPWGERIPRRLARVIERALADDPAKRYPSAAEVGRELDAFLAQRPMSHDRSRFVRAMLWCRRNPQLSFTAAAAAALAIVTMAAYLTVRDLRGQRRDLTSEVDAKELDNAALAERGSTMRAELASADTQLAATKAQIARDGDSLGKLERALADAQTTYRGVIAALDQKLHDAGAETRQLVGDLTIARSARAAAELGRNMYEGFWTTARGDADRAAKERDQAQKERDTARSERDQLAKERDAARADRDKLADAKSQADADVARLTAAADVSAKRIAELEREIAPLHAGSATGGGSGSGQDPAAPLAAP